MGQVEEIKKKTKRLAMIIRNNYDCEGADFITPNVSNLRLELHYTLTAE